MLAAGTAISRAASGGMDASQVFVPVAAHRDPAPKGAGASCRARGAGPGTLKRLFKSIFEVRSDRISMNFVSFQAFSTHFIVFHGISSNSGPALDPLLSGPARTMAFKQARRPTELCGCMGVEWRPFPCLRAQPLPGSALPSRQKGSEPTKSVALRLCKLVKMQAAHLKRAEMGL